MKEIFFIHTADIHFGVENYGSIDLKTGLNNRLLDFKKQLDSIIQFSIEKDIDLFIFAGDAYKTSHPTPTHQKLLLEAFLKLVKKKIPIVLVLGNHDYPGNSCKAHVLDIFKQLKDYPFYVFDYLEHREIETKKGKVNVIGVPWPHKYILSKYYLEKNRSFIFNSKTVLQDITESLKEISNSIDQNLPTFLVGHLTLEKGLFSNSEKQGFLTKDIIFKASDLAIKPIDYIALGHLHRFQEYKYNNIPIVYSGSIEAIDFGEEHDEKGFVYGKVNEKKEILYKKIALKTRPFISFYIEDFLNTEDIIKLLDSKKNLNGVAKVTIILKEQIEIDKKRIQEFINENFYYNGGILFQSLHKIKRIKESEIIGIKESIRENYLLSALEDYCLLNQHYLSQKELYRELLFYYQEKKREE